MVEVTGVAHFGSMRAASIMIGKEPEKVGALIEETDIRDINAKKAVTDEADILTVYGNLLCGSQDHLRAFNDALVAQGVTYVPQAISQAEWDAIANSPAGTCI